MKQQINLYVKKVKQRVPFSARICLVSVLTVAALLVAGSVLTTQGLGALRQDVADLKRHKSELEVKTDTLLTQKRPRQESSALRLQHDQLAEKLVDQQRLSKLLVRLAPQGSGVFSPLLKGLSEQALSGVWLTRIQAGQSAAVIALQGNARSADLIPKYLKQLGQAEAYQNAHFDQFELGEADTGLQFKVSGSRTVGGGA